MSIWEIIKKIVEAELNYLIADWWILTFAIVIAAGIKVYVGQEQIREWMQGKTKLSIPGSVGFGAFTPLCSCGTMAVIISMFVTSLPWGPVMAFLVSSPLTSPSQFIFQSGVLGLDIAIAVLISSLVMGLVVGFLVTFMERKTNFFKDQFRIKAEQEATIEKSEECCSVNKDKRSSLLVKMKIKEFFSEIYEIGVKRILIYFMIFIAIGQLVEIYVPTEWILTLFSPDKIYSIPLAALVGLPLYVSGSASLPLLKSLLEVGAGEGAVLAFLIAGQATSIAVIMGISTFIKRKAVIFYIIFIMASSILSGFIYSLNRI